MNAQISAHDLRSYDCAWPGCPREARRQGGYCDMGHVGSPPASVHDGAGRILPGSLAHLTDTPEPEEATAVAPSDTTLCKIPGCQEQPLDRHGMYAKLCAAHKREKQAARKTVKPPPVASPPVTDDPSGADLVELARHVQETRREAARALQAHQAAKDALRAALGEEE